METNQIPSPPQNSSVPMPSPAPQGSSSNIGMAILAYIGILVIIPLVTNKDDQFVKFHSKQGLVLLIIEIVIWAFSSFFFMVPFLGFFIGQLFWLVWLGVVALIIIGIMNAANGQMKELPIIGQFAKNFNF